MSKKSNKRLSLVMSLILSLVTAVSVCASGCGNRGGGGVDIDTSKTQLYIGAYGGGYGTAFLEDLKIRFEEYVGEREFPDGTKGVQVIYTDDKDRYTAEYMSTNISTDKRNDIFYLSGSKLSDFIAGNKIADITDVVKADLSEFGDPEGSTIEKKLGDSIKGYLNRDGKYYELPFADTSLGVVYNVEVFEEYELYIAKDGSPAEKLVLGEESEHSGDPDDYSWVGATGERSAGPDGKYETEYDNGLPATIADFEALLVKIWQEGIDSFVWTEDATYPAFFPRAMYVNHHGAEEAGAILTANTVTTDVITSFVNGQPQIVEKEISESSVAELSKQAGHYYGLDLFEKIIDSETTSDYAYKGYAPARVHEAFIKSNLDRNETPIAFMIEGSWWESEAEGTGIFNRTKDKMERKFGWLSMPNANETEYQKRINGEKNGTIIGDATSIVIKAGLSETKLNLAKEFIKFSLTNESLRRFSIKTSIPAPYKYEMEENDFTDMTNFAKSYLDVYLNSDVLPAYTYDAASKSTAINAIAVQFNYYGAIKADNSEFEFFTSEFSQKGTSAIEYFEGLYHYTSKTTAG